MSPFGSKEVQNKSKKTLIKKYGVDNSFKAKEIQEKLEKTNLERYGVEHCLASPEIKKKVQKTNLKKYGFVSPLSSKQVRDKAKKKWLEKYGVENPLSAKEIRNKLKRTNLEKYGFENPMQNPDVAKKGWETKRKNGTLNTSKPEDRVYDKLKITYPNIIRECATDPRYPFSCDFYISEKDLFIECNFSWTHGKKPFKEPFDKNKTAHLKLLNEWQEKSNNHPYFKSAINTWTVRDPLKRETAKKNKLNYIEIFYEKDIDRVMTE